MGAGYFHARVHRQQRQSRGIQIHPSDDQPPKGSIMVNSPLASAKESRFIGLPHYRLGDEGVSPWGARACGMEAPPAAGARPKCWEDPGMSNRREEEKWTCPRQSFLCHVPTDPPGCFSRCGRVQPHSVQELIQNESLWWEVGGSIPSFRKGTLCPQS